MERRDDLAVTTWSDPPLEVIARAEAVSARLQAPLHLRHRTSVAKVHAITGADLLYIIGREREELRARSGEALFVHPGMFYLRRADGAAHPLTRAAAPEGPGSVRTVLDATLGVAGDALHLAWWLGAEVTGLEASPLIFSLVEEGLARMGRDARGYAASAARITPVWTPGLAYLEAAPSGSADVVYLDPMFDVPQTAQPGFELLRRVACAEPLTAALLESAIRVAAQRVLLKIPGASPLPDLGGAEAAFNRRVRSNAVDFLIVEKILSDPVWEAPRLGVAPR